MLKTAKIDVIHPENINIALVKTEQVNMLQNIEIDRKTGDVPNNVILNIGESVKTSPNASGILNITNNNPDILVTDSYIINDDEEYPLWYVHQLRNYSYNESLVVRTIKRRINSDTKLLMNITEKGDPSTEPETIIKNSITITTNTGSTLTPNTDYRIDYINSGVELLTSYPNNTVLIITMYTIKPNIILTENGLPVDINTYRSEYEFIYADQISLTGSKRNLFKTQIISSLKNKDNITYSVVYNKLNNGIMSETTEILKSTPLFKYTDSNPTDREYALIGQNISVSGKSNNHTYYVMFNTNRSELITIDANSKTKTDLWYTVITPGTFTVSGNTYRVLEKDTYRFIDNLYRLEHVYLEQPEIINSTQIKTKNNNLFIKVDDTGMPMNVSITINGKLESSTIISDYDQENGFLFLKKPVSVLDQIQVSYVYMIKTIPYKYLQLNPSVAFSSLNTTDQMMKNYIVFLLPEHVLNSEKQRSIFHVEYYKYPSLYTDKQEIEISESALIEYLSGTNPETGLSNIYDIIDTTYLSNVSETNITPFILGVVSTINTSTPSSVSSLDIRVRGGGVPESINIQQLELELPGALHNIDICYLDGRPYPANNVYVVRIPTNYISSYRTTLEEFDKVLVRTLRTLTTNKQETFSYTYTLDKIKSVIKRFLPASAHIKFEII